MLKGPLARHGYDWWWHSFTAQDRITGEDKAFFIEFFLCNPASGGSEPVFGQLASNREAGVFPSYLMVKAGTWGDQKCQLHRFFGWDDVKLHEQAPYEVSAGDCLACETALRGSIDIKAEDAAAHPEWMCDCGSMKWDIKIDKKIAFNVGYGASKPLRDMEAFAMYWHAEGMKSAYEGSITFNGREYVVTSDRCYGYADKNWGRDFTSPWVWLSSNCLISKKTGNVLTNSVFDIGGGRPKIYFVPLDRRLLGVFYYEGREFDFNFSKLHLKVKTDFSFEEKDDVVVLTVSGRGDKDVETYLKNKEMAKEYGNF